MLQVLQTGRKNELLDKNGIEMSDKNFPQGSSGGVFFSGQSWLCLIVVITILNIIRNCVPNCCHQENVGNTKFCFSFFFFNRANKSSYVVYVVLSTVLGESLKQEYSFASKGY